MIFSWCCIYCRNNALKLSGEHAVGFGLLGYVCITKKKTNGKAESVP